MRACKSRLGRAGIPAVILGLALSAASLAPRLSTAQEPAKPAPAAEQKGTVGEAQLPEQQAASIEAMSNAFRTVAAHVRPAVVQITATVQAKQEKKMLRRQQQPQVDPKQIPEPFREFFEEFGGQPQEPTPEYGRGSGVIIDADLGLILTNNHVVGGKQGTDELRLEVMLDSGRNVMATVLGQDPKTDVALIKITDIDNLKKAGVRLAAIKIGDSRKMEVGDWVLAIGSPFGLAQTVTQGIISAKGRNNLDIAGIEDFIQTDAAINPGNSGGPLVNMRGELIGINTAIATSGLTRGYMGIGFAIPTEMIKQVLPDLKEGREIVRGYLGVAIKDLDKTPGLASTLGLEEDRGVLVDDVFPDSPAGKAGLKADDVVLAVGDTKIDSVQQLQTIVSQTKPGNKLNMTVWRDSKKITVPVEIEVQPEDFFATKNWGRGGGRSPEGAQESDETEIESVGMTVNKVTPELAKKYNWDYDEVKGQIIVTKVDPLGEAGSASLRLSAGDIIVSVQGEPVKSARGLAQALSRDALAKGVRLRVRSEYATRTLFLKVTP